ncbi:MAG: HepT-like ribonuclease domain-containing protein [Promethearchaeati archaeon]
MAYERILQRIAFIENQLNLLGLWTPENKEVFLGDLKLQAAIERNMQNIIEAIIQICIQLVKFFNLGPPTSEDSILELLKPKLENYDLIKEFKNLRI